MNRVTLFRTLGRLYGPARSLAAAALLGTAVLGSQAFAQDPVSIGNDEFQDFTARDSAGYWTSTELSRAQLQELLVPSLVLQTFAIQRCASGCTAEQEATRPLFSRRPG